MIKVEYCPTKEQVADMLTKGVSSDMLDGHKQVVGVVVSPRSLERVGVSDAEDSDEDGVKSPHNLTSTFYWTVNGTTPAARS